MRTDLMKFEVKAASVTDRFTLAIPSPQCRCCRRAVGALKTKAVLVVLFKQFTVNELCVRFFQSYKVFVTILLPSLLVVLLLVKK